MSSPPLFFLFRHRFSSFVCCRCLSWDSVLLFFDSACSLPRLSLSVWLFISLFIHTCVCVCSIWVLFLCLSRQCFCSQQPSFLSFRCNYTLTKCLIPSSDSCCAYPCFTPSPLYRSHLYLVYLSSFSRILSLSLSLFDVPFSQPSHQDYFNKCHLSL